MAVLQTKKRNALPESDFALPEQRKYPLPDAAHVRNAAARLEQEHKAGKISDADYASAKRRIAAAAKRFGVHSEYNAPAGGKKTRVHVRAELGHGGSLHVRHMSDRDVHLDGVDVALADAGDKPVWIQLAKPGVFRGHPAGPFELNDKVFSEIVTNFRATQNRAIPIDFEHASEADPTEGSIPVDGAPAQGWIRDLRIDGGGLWGLVEWGDKAREYIRSGAYKFFSPAIRFNAKDRVTGERIGARMTSGALTNNPFLDGLKPLTAKDAVTMKLAAGALAHGPGEYMPGIKAALKMPELCSARECCDMVDRLRDHLDAAGPDGTHEGIDLAQYLHPLREAVGATPGMTWDEVFEIVEVLIQQAIDEHVEEYHEGESPSMPSAPEEAGATDGKGSALSDADTETTDMKDLAEATTKIAELSLNLKDESARADKAEAELASLRDWKEKREAKDIDERVELAFETYKDARKLTDADKEAMRIVLTAKPETFEKQYPKVKAGDQHLLKNVTDRRPAVPELVQGEGDDKIANETFAQTATRLMSEKKISYAAASNLAFKLRAGR